MLKKTAHFLQDGFPYSKHTILQHSLRRLKNHNIHTWKTCSRVSSRLENFNLKFKLLVDACTSLLVLAFFKPRHTLVIAITIDGINRHVCTTCEINAEMVTSLVEEALNWARCKSCVERKMPVWYFNIESSCDLSAHRKQTHDECTH